MKRIISMLVVAATLFTAQVFCYAEESEEAALPESVVKAITVPENAGVEDLEKFLNSMNDFGALREKMPENPSQELIKEFLDKLGEAKAKASAQLLKQPKLDAKQVELAAGAMLESIMLRSRMDGDIDVKSEIDDLLESVSKHDAKEVVWEVRLMSIPMFKPEGTSPQEMIKNQLGKLLDLLKVEDGKYVKPQHVRIIMTILTPAERFLSPEELKDVYSTVITIFKKSDDEMMNKLGDKMSGTLRRITLKGSKLEFSAVTLDGKKVDIKDYKGKLVLVDFWATWCGPCVGEIPNMLKMYKAYHEKGFEIIGLSLDQDHERLAEFVKDRELPWTIVITEKDAAGSGDPATYYGVSGIPTMFLVDENGVVIDTAARGPRLEKLLKERLGEPAAEDAPAVEAEEKDKNE